MTISSIGTTARTYSTLQAWENACPANLVTSTDTWEGECYNDSEFVVAGNVLTIAGITTNATFNVQLRCATGQSFRDNAGVRTNALDYSVTNGVGIRTSSNYSTCIDNQVNFTTFDGLQIKNDGNGNAAAVALQTTGTDGTYRNTIIRAARVGFSDGGGSTNKLYNVLAIVSGSWNAIEMSRPSNEAIGCTAVCAGGGGAGTAFVTYAYGTNLIKDCAGFGFTNFQTGAGGATTGSGANCTDLATAFGSTHANQVSKTFANQFESTTTDFRAKTGADLINNGATDANILVDISNFTRSLTTPTIGCWEFSGGGGATVFTTLVGPRFSLAGSRGLAG